MTKNRRSVSVCALLALTFFCRETCLSQSPLNQGELNVFIDSTANYTINVRAVGSQYGTRANWFPVVSYGPYSVSTAFYGNHVDRGGGPGTGLPVIGYGIYEVEYNNHVLFVDFRDGDYQTAAYRNLDIYIHYWPSIGKFVRTDIDPDRVFNAGQTVGIWEDGNKWDDEDPRIPATVRCFLNGGYSGTVVVDQSIHSSPYQIIFNQGNHLITAPTIQGASWWFDHWSDGGEQSHTVNLGLPQFAKIYTAYYRHEMLSPEDKAAALGCYPNPFNPSTWISYSIQNSGHVRLAITDILGREVAVLLDKEEEPGSHRVQFDGSRLASGVYYCRLHKPGGIEVIPILLAK